MFFERVKTPGVAHCAYVLGTDSGIGIVVDPRRDVDEYLFIAAQQSLSIQYVVETHRQEDFVMGASELARLTGAKIVNGRHDMFGHGDIRLQDGEKLAIDDIVLVALHTPGHTPESMSYALVLKKTPSKALGVFTGDALFIGETGRTDLPDPQATGQNASLLYDAIHRRIAPLGDQALLYPAHGAGSVCGGNIANRDESTIGFEKTYNPVFVCSREVFVKRKIQERIPRPPYFRLMEKLNFRGGAPLPRSPGSVKVLSPRELHKAMSRGLVIDAREPEAFAGGHIPGSVSVWMEGLPVFGGWVANETTPLYLVLDKMRDMETAVLSLMRIGVDNIEGVLAGGFDQWRKSGLPIEHSGAITPRELHERRSQFQIIDVREDSEFEEGHIQDARHMYVGYVDEHLTKVSPPLDKKKPVAVTCSVGHRAGVATSILKRQGYESAHNVLGGMTSWSKQELPEKQGDESSVGTMDVEGERK